MILAQLAGYSLVHLLVMVVVIAACIGIVLIALRQFGVSIPPFMIQIFWICLCAVIAIFAIKFVAGM